MAAGPRTSLDVVLSQTEVAALRCTLRDAAAGGGGGGRVLVAAPGGSGLTTLVRLLVKELDLEAVWASAGRVAALAGATRTAVAPTGRRKVVVLDEYDVLVADPHTQDAVKAVLAEAGPVPVLCLARAPLRAKMADAFRRRPCHVFRAPAPQRLAAACLAAFPGADPDAALALCRGAKGDLRSVLAALAFSERGRAAAPVACAKDATLTPLEATELVLTADDVGGVAGALRLSDATTAALPSGIFENYPRATRDAHKAAAAADLFSLADVAGARGPLGPDTAPGLVAVLGVAGPATVLGPAATKDVEFDKFGTAWSKANAACARAKALRGLAWRRAEAGLGALPAADLGLVALVAAGGGWAGWHPADAAILKRLAAGKKK